MSEADKVIRSLAVAFVLVMVVFATLVIGSNNPPSGPSIPAYGRLTYAVNGTGDAVQFNGIICYHFEHPEEGFFHLSVSWNEGDDGPDFYGVPISFIKRSGTYMDTTTIDTPWGEKVVNRLLSSLWQATPEVSARGGIMIGYYGAETDLLYHLDLVMPTYRATYDLTDTNMTLIGQMDRHETENMDDLIFDEQFSEGLIVRNEGAGTAVDMFMEPEENKDYKLMFSASNYSMFVMSEEDVSEMIEGGLFCNQTITMVDANNSTALLDEGRYFIYIASTGYEDAWSSLSLDVIEEV